MTDLYEVIKLNFPLFMEAKQLCKVFKHPQSQKLMRFDTNERCQSYFNDFFCDDTPNMGT